MLSYPKEGGNRDNARAELEVTMSRSSLDDMIFLRLPEVKAVTGLSKASLYALIGAKSFPAPVHLGPRTVRG